MRLSRRELLGTLLVAAPLGCARREGGRRIEGSIVGGAHATGHRLRGTPFATPERFEETGVAILGGGIAGLSAAWAFEHAGLRDYVVLELEEAPGGTARSGEGPVTPYPWAAHYVPVPDPANRPLVKLLEEVGAIVGRDAEGHPVCAENVLCREPQERLYFRGEWYEGLYPRVGASPRDLEQLAAFERDVRGWAAWRDAEGRRAFDLPRLRGSEADAVRALDDESMAAYLDRHGWDSPRLRWWMEYACRDDFGTLLHETSAWAGIHYHAARLANPEADEPEYLTWPEGNGRLVAHLAGSVGNRLRLGALVTNVRPGPEHVDVTWYDAETGEVRGLRAEHVVCALPRFVCRFVIEPWREAPPEHLAATQYGSWMVANLTLSDRPAGRGYPLSWDNVLFDSPSLGYVVATHQSGSDHGPTVLTYYLPLHDAAPRSARQRLLDTPWEDWVEAILADLGPAHPGLSRLVERIDVYLWGHAMVRPVPGFLFGSALAESRRPLGRVHFAHTDLSGMALFEEAQYWGVRGAEDVMRAQGRAFDSWLAVT